jgi:chromosome segregation ATPase
MGQVVRSSTGSVGVSKCAVAEAELKRLQGELKKLRKEIHSRASVREDKEIQVRSADNHAKEIDRLRIQIQKLTDTHEAYRIRKLDEKNAELDKVIAEKNKQSSDLLAQIEETKRQVERSNELVSSLESERNELHRTLNERQRRAVKAREFKQKLEAERQTNKKLKSRLAKLRSDQQTAAKKAAASNEAEVRRLTAEMSDVQSRLGEAILRSSDLQEQLDKLNTAHTDLTRSDNYKNAKIAELATSLHQERTKISELEATLSSLNNEIETLNSEIANIKQDRDQAQGQLRQLGVLNDELTKQLSEANETINASLAKLKQSLDNAASLEKEAKNTKEKALELTRVNSGLRSQLDDLQRELDAKKRLEGNKSTKNEQEISRLKDEIQRITLQIKEREAEIALLQQKLSEYDAKMNSILQDQSKDNDYLNSTISNITRLLKETNVSKSEMSKMLSASTASVATIQRELDEANRTALVLNSHVARLEQSLETEVRTREGLIEAATKEKIATDERNRGIVSEKEANIADLEDKLNGKTAELSGMGETLKSKELELQTSKNLLSEVTESLHKERNELAKLKDNLSELRGLISNQSALKQQIKSATESLQGQLELNTNLKKQVDVATAKLSEVEQKASALEALLSRVKSAASCNDGSDIVACIEGKMKHHERLVKELHQCTERANASTEKHNLEIRAMRSSIQAKEDTLQTVQLEIERLKNERTQDQETKAKEISGLQKRETLLIKKLADANDQITKLKARFDAAANNAQKEIAGIKDLIASNQREHNSELYRARAELERKQTELTESREKAAGLESRLDQSSELSNQELSALRGDLDIRNKENDGLREEIAVFQEKLKELAKLKEEAEARYQDIQRKLAEINSVLGDETTEITADRDTVDNTADKTVDRVISLNKQNEANTRTLVALGRVTGCPGDSTDGLVACVSHSMEVVRAVKQTIPIDSNDDVRIIRDKIGSLKTSAEEARILAESLLETNKVVQKENKEKREKIQDLQNELSRCTSAMEQSNTEHAAQISQAKDAITKAKERISKYELETNRLTSEIAAKEQDKARTDTIIEDLKRRIETLEGRNQHAADEFRKLEEWKAKLENNLRSCNSSLKQARENAIGIEELRRAYTDEKEEFEKRIQQLESEAREHDETTAQTRESVRLALSKIATEHKNAIAALEELEAANKTLKDQKTDLENRRMELERGLESCNKRLAEAAQNATEITRLQDELNSAQKREGELGMDIKQLKMEAVNSRNSCLLGLIKRETPIIDRGITVALWETADELVSHFERSVSYKMPNRLSAFNSIKQSLRAYIQKGISSSSSQLHQIQERQLQHREPPVAKGNKRSPVERGSTSKRSQADKAPEPHIPATANDTTKKSKATSALNLDPVAKAALDIGSKSTRSLHAQAKKQNALDKGSKSTPSVPTPNAVLTKDEAKKPTKHTSAAKQSTSDTGSASTQSAPVLSDMENLIQKEVADINTILSGYVKDSGLMRKMPSHTIALSMHRITNSLISLTVAELSASDHRLLEKRLTDITDSAVKDMAAKIQTILSSAFKAASPSYEADQGNPSVVSDVEWGIKILKETDSIPISAPTVQLDETPLGILIDRIDDNTDSTVVDRSSLDRQYLENEEKKLAVTELEEAGIDMLTRMSYEIGLNESTYNQLGLRVLQIMLLLTYIINADLTTEGSDSTESYKLANTILAKLLSTEYVNERASTQGEYNKVQDTIIYELEKVTNEQNKEIVQLKTAILTAISEMSEERSSDARYDNQNANDNRIIITASVNYKNYTNLKEQHTDARRHNRPVTPLPPISGFGAYI